MPLTQKPLMAVLVDIENFVGFCSAQGSHIDLGPVLDRLAEIGRPVIRHSFGDISAMPKEFSKFKLRQMLQQNHVVHEDVPHLPGCKNSADIRLVVDMMHLAHTRPDISYFAVIGHDRDFIFPMNYLRGMGRSVIGCGPSRSLVNQTYQRACDLFLFHDELVSGNKQPAAMIGQDVIDITADSQVAELTPDNITDEAGRLIIAIRGVEARGTAARAPVVGSLMRTLYPEFDPKTLDGSFKKFCLRMAEAGVVKLSNPSDAAFVLSVAVASTPDQTSEVTSPGLSLVDAYRAWILQKMKMSMPTSVQRQSIYAALAESLDRNQNSLPVPLKTLAEQIGHQVPDMEHVAFRILYGLFRCRALTCSLSSDAFNPGVVAIEVSVERLDLHFMVNTLGVFRRDNTCLPFDPAAWSVVFHGDTSAALAIGMMAEIGDLANEKPFFMNDKENFTPCTS